MIRLGALGLAAFALAGQGSPVPPDAQRESAIASIHRRASTVTPGTPGARQLARELSEIGRAYLGEGQAGRAVELLGEAYGLDEENGLVLAELTLAYVRLEDFDSARFYLRRAEERVALGPAEIFGVLGDVYDSLHRLEDAVTAWTEFVRLGGQDPAISRRLGRVRDEIALARGQRSLQSGHFSVFADPAVSEETLREAGAELEASYARQSALFGPRLFSSQVVVLHAGRAYFSLVSAPDWASGVYDGKIRVSVEAGEPWAMEGVLNHELAHVMVRAASGGRAPGWLHEGLAQWQEGRRLPRRDFAAAAGRTERSLAALESSFRGARDRAAARSAYAQSLSVVEYLAAIRGEGALACTVIRLGEGASLSRALSDEMGLSEEEIVAGWRKWAGV